MTDTVASEHTAPSVVRTLDVLAKAGLVVLLWIAIANPELGNLRGKAAGLRAVGYPAMAFVLPAAWSIPLAIPNSTTIPTMGTLRFFAASTSRPARPASTK